MLWNLDIKPKKYNKIKGEQITFMKLIAGYSFLNKRTIKVLQNLK